MTLKKLTVIAVAASVMICTSVYVGMHLNTDNEMEFSIGKEEYTINGSTKIFDESMKNLPVIDEQTQKLLIPLRWVIEELNGSVTWDKQNHATIIQYQGKNIRIETDKQKAAVNGYGVILQDPPVMKKGCTYVTADFMSENFDTNIIWNGKQKQITLRTEAIQRPIVYKNNMFYEKGNRYYNVEVPVIIGLNDGNYEKNLNHKLSSDTTEQIHDYMTKHEKDTTISKLSAKYTVPYRSKELISIVFLEQMESDGKTEYHKKTINIDLQTQKFLKLGDLFRKKDYYQKLAKELSIQLKELPEQTEQQFYFDKDKGLVVFWQNEQGTEEEYIIPFIEIKKLLKDNYQFLLQQNQP
ncbi:MAG: hypothetical protein HFE57_06315 [Firmicutes bacterium]|nr:hypothetical protein [Bacillota bacterium]